MRSGQLAHLTGVSTDTLRHYERLGLLPLPQRTDGNYRQYPAASQQRVELIQRAMAVGFSLSELKAACRATHEKTILAVQDSGGAPCRHVRALMHSKIRDIDEQIRSLISLRVEMNRLSKAWDKRLRRTKPGQVARLLEAVPPRPRARVASGLQTFPKKKGQ